MTVSESSATLDVRPRLLGAAARILSTRGPGDLTLRQVAAAAGTSTMAVYTYFGSMPNLVAEVMRAGFDRLAAALDNVPRSDDPLTDLIRVGLAYHDFARSDPTSYAIMTGVAPLGKFALSRSDEEAARAHAYGALVEAVRRTIEAGTFTGIAAEPMAAQLLTAMHGYVLLESRGTFGANGFDAVLHPMMRAQCVAAGADPAAFDERVAELTRRS